MPSHLKPLAATQSEAIKLIKSEKIFKRALRAGWIKPVIQGGLGRASIFDYGDIEKLWDRLKTGEMPPKLPSELRKSVRKFFAQLWDSIRGVEPEAEPIYVFLSRGDVEKEMARKYAEAQKEREAKEIEEEKQRMSEEFVKQRPKEINVEVDPNLF